MNVWSNAWRRAGAAIWIIALLAVLAWLIWRFGSPIGLVENRHKLLVFLLVILIVIAARLLPRLLAHLKRQSHRERGQAEKVYAPSEQKISMPRQPAFDVSALRDRLRDQHGVFWRRRVRLLLVIGEPDQIHAIAPTLASRLCLEGQGTVLLWGGSAQTMLDQPFLQQWAELCRWRALDGVVWALNKTQLADDTLMGEGARQVQRLASALSWHLPLHLWQITTPPFPQPTRNRQPIGCLLPPRLTPEVLASSLENLIDPLRSAGLAQMQDVSHHDFLLRLSRDLQAEGIDRWRQALAPLLGVFSRGVPLRGLWFSPPLPPTGSSFEMDKAWQGVFSDTPVKRRLGWGTYRIAYTLTLSLTLLWTAGLLLSFTHNRTQVTRVQTVLHTLQNAPQGDAQLPALNDLVHELARLDYRAAHGTPWYQRFGLNQNQPLLETLWPHYVEANNRLIRDPLAATLHQQLTALLKLAPDNPGRTKDAYAQLKAYLMMARPEKTDAALLLKTLDELAPARPGTPPSLRLFYAEHLPANPSWRIPLHPRLIAQVRQLLLRQLGQRNAEASLYQQVLDDAAHHYPALGLRQLVGGHRGLRTVCHRRQRARRLHPPGLGRAGARRHRQGRRGAA